MFYANESFLSWNTNPDGMRARNNETLLRMRLHIETWSAVRIYHQLHPNGTLVNEYVER